MAWVAAVYTGRFDDPPDRVADAVGELAANADLAAATVALLPALDPARFEVRWPVVTAVTDDGDGWWLVAFTLKSTSAGHVGPTTQPVEARVHVSDGLVDSWQLVAA